MKKSKAFGLDELLVEVWKRMGAIGIKFLTRLFNKLQGCKPMCLSQSMKTKRTHSAVKTTEL